MESTVPIVDAWLQAEGHERRTRFRALCRAVHEDPNIAVELLATLDDALLTQREQVLRALSFASSLPFATSLLDAAIDGDAAIRTVAALALARVERSPRAWLQLLALTNDANAQVAAAALAGAVSVAPTHQHVRALGALMHSGDRAVRAVALRPLAHASHALVELLDDSLRTADALQRRRVLDIALHVGAPIDALIDRACRLARPGSDELLRRAATSLVGRASQWSRSLAEVLREAAHAWDPMLRATSAVSLARLSVRHRSARTLLQPLLQSRDTIDDLDLALALDAVGPCALQQDLCTRLALRRSPASLHLAQALLRATQSTDGLDDADDSIACVADQEVDSGPSQREALARLTTDNDPVRRAAAAVLLALSPGLEGAIVLQSLTNDREELVREIARQSLERVMASPRV